jgi:hypothetical protein
MEAAVSTIVGVDLSLSATGLVTWRDGQFFVTTVVTPAGMDPPERHHLIVTRILAMACGPTLFVVEGRIDIAAKAELVDGEAKITGGLRGNTTLDLAELRGVVNYGICQYRRPRVDVHPSTLKVYATGNHRASKTSMVLAARGWLGEHLPVTNDDEADAAWLVAMALERYADEPLCQLPKKNRAAVAKPAWPEFTLEETP